MHEEMKPVWCLLQTMGICPGRCRSNMTILENTSESATPGTQPRVNNKQNKNNVVKMQPTGPGLSLQGARTPSPCPCATTQRSGT